MTTLNRELRPRDAEDENWVASVSRGDSGAHRALFDRYHARVYAFVLRRLRDPGFADEAVADVFFEVWRSAKAFRGDSTVSTWIFGIASYKCMAIRRDRTRATRNVVFSNNVETLHPVAGDVDLDRQVDARKALRKVEAGLALLSKEQREVIHLAFIDGLDYDEIAERLGVSENTVKTRVLRARRRLRKRSNALEGLQS